MAWGGIMEQSVPYYNHLLYLITYYYHFFSFKIAMPRKKLLPPKKGLRQKWEAEGMLKAITAVCEGTRKLNEAARHFKVPK